MYKLLKILFLFAVLFLALDLAFPFRPASDYSTTVYDTNGNILSTFLNNTDKWRLYAPLEEVSDDFVKSILEKEDSGYYYHLGFNPFSILRAAYSNLSSAKVISGASTITMQLARLLEPKERTIVNKIIEVFRAMQSHSFWWQYRRYQISFNILSWQISQRFISRRKHLPVFYSKQPK
jgi:penicillin-binding protein 1C